MYPKLWVYLYQHMNVIRVNIQTHYLCLMLLAYFDNDVLQTFCYILYQHLASIFGTPDDMILARVVDVPMRLVG